MLCCVVLCCVVLCCVVLCCVVLCCVVLCCVVLCCVVLCCVVLCCVVLCCVVLCCVVLCCVVLCCVVLCCVVLCCVVLCCVVLCCVVCVRCEDIFLDGISSLVWRSRTSSILLYCIALHCIALHCIALHCIALHCIALHCIALYVVCIRCEDVFLDGVQLEPNIARNQALKENIFMMIVCIELRIPLFLVGKPGSSKSLARTIVADAMQGKRSHSELFRQLKEVCPTITRPHFPTSVEIGCN